VKILIVTKSFVREVSSLIRYAACVDRQFRFRVVMPYSREDSLPASVSIRKLFFSRYTRASWYSPLLMLDIKSFRPEILHVFEEFSGLIAFQSLIFLNLFCHHSKTMVYSAENIPGNVRSVLRVPMKYVMRHSDMAFVCSQSVKQVLKAEGYTESIEVFPLGVDVSRFRKLSCEQLKGELALDGKFIIGYVGRLLEIKGVFLLIEIMRYLPGDIHLLMVGSGPEKENLKAVAAKYHLGHRVHLVGNVPYTQLPQYMNCMDIGIVPSRTTNRWKEQFGRVIVEFMSCEVPVIGSNSGSIPEVLGDAGYIFQENNLQELIHLVKTLKEHPEIRQKLGKQGRQRAMTHYTLEIMCDRFLSMYQKLMKIQSNTPTN
jgi:glycosyltransferase involved in cell wall biosynthesis